MVAQHFAAGELSPSYSLSRNVSVGTYYLYRHGLDADVTRHTHFVAARAGVANLRLPARFVSRLDPQLVYLRLDDRAGIYLNSRVTVAKRDLPAPLRALHRRAPNVALNSCCDMPSNSRASVRASPPPNAARAANGDSSGSARENFALHGQTSLDIWRCSHFAIPLGTGALTKGAKESARACARRRDAAAARTTARTRG